jgi:transcriptional regulator with XRE-family HTH domain
MINKVHFGKRMALLRRRMKLSQVDLAEKLGVTSQAISKWECGTALPDIELLLELSS